MRNGNPRTPRHQAREARELSLREILPHFTRKEWLSDGSVMVSCPVPTHGRGRGDLHPSLKLSETPDGRLMWHCKVGCSQEAVGEALRRLAGRPSRGNSRPAPSRTEQNRPESQDSEEPAGLTVAQYCQAKRLDPTQLQQWHVSECLLSGRPALKMEYRNERGEPIATRYRLSLAGENRFRWARGNRPILYGLWRTREWADEAVYLCEGESDVHSCWTAGLPSLGVPGAGVWEAEWWFSLGRFQRVVVLPDSDGAGEALVQRLAETAPPIALERTEVLQLPCKDVSELWTRLNADADAFRAELEQLPRTPLSEFREAEQEPEEQYIFTPIRCSEIQPETQPPIVPSLIYTGSITWLVGISGVGKTSLALEIADCLTTGGGLLWGKVPVQHARLLWLDYDHRFPRLREVMDAFYGEKERDLLILPEEQRYALSWETLQPYIELIRREGIELIVSDTGFDWLHVLDDAKDAEAREKTLLLRELADATGVAVVLLHHPSKAPGRAGSTMGMSGHHRYAGRADVIAELVHDGSEGQDWVRLRILKDRYGERKEYRFARQGRRFIPLEPASLPKSEWHIVEQYLETHGQASYEELLEALTQAGYKMTLHAVQQRIYRYRSRGLITITREGFQSRAVVRLAHVNILIPTENHENHENLEKDENVGAVLQVSHASSYPLTDHCENLEKDENLEAVLQPSQDSQDSQDSQHSHDSHDSHDGMDVQSVARIVESIGAEPSLSHAEPVPSQPSTLDDALELWLQQASRPDDPFRLEPDEVDAVRLLWRVAQSRGFPPLTLPTYNFVIGEGEQAWLEACQQMAGTPAVQLALEQLQQRPNRATQPSLFNNDSDANSGTARASDETTHCPTIPS